MSMTRLIFAALLLTACNTESEKISEAPVAIPVLATVAEIRDIPVYIEAVGTLHASVAAEVRPQVSGTISEVLVSEGDWVDVNTPLIRIDPSTYEVRVQESSAKLDMDNAVLSSALRKLERFRTLADKDLISKAEWDELETAAEKANATIKADEASLRAAEIDLERCHLRACVAGRLGRMHAHPGQLVSNAQTIPLALIAKMDTLLVDFTLTEKDAQQLPGGQPQMELGCIHSNDCLGVGRVTFIDNHYDPKTGLILVRGTVDNTQMKLRPGQSVRVRLPVRRIAEAKLIPQKAIKYNHEGPYIYVVNPAGIVTRRKVTLGMTQGAQVIVTEGLQPNEQVITDGHMRIYPGSQVEVKE